MFVVGFMARFVIVYGMFKGLFSIWVKNLDCLGAYLGPVLWLLRGCLDCVWPFLWPVCGWFYESICDCLWYVQRIVLGTVWVKNLYYLRAFLESVFMAY